MYIVKLNGKIITRLLYMEDYNNSIKNYMRYYKYYKKEVYEINKEKYEIYFYEDFEDGWEIIYEKD